MGVVLRGLQNILAFLFYSLITLTGFAHYVHVCSIFYVQRKTKTFCYGLLDCAPKMPFKLPHIYLAYEEKLFPIDAI